MIRKATSTAVLEGDPKHARHVASTMAHSGKTQGIHYHVQDKENLSKEGSKFIRNHYYSERKKWDEEETSLVREAVRNKEVPLTPKRLKTHLKDIDASPRQLYDKARRESQKMHLENEDAEVVLTIDPSIILFKNL